MGQLQSNLEILSGLNSQLQADQDALFSRAKQQNVYVESLLGQYRSLERVRGDRRSASVGLPALDQELDKLKAQLADLSSHYTERHPDVRKLKEQIAKTEGMKRQITTELQANERFASRKTVSAYSARTMETLDRILPNDGTPEPSSRPTRSRLQIDRMQSKDLQAKTRCELPGSPEPDPGTRTAAG